MSTLRFATIGTSGICDRFIDALGQVEGAELAACYSRDAAHAREFAQAHGAPLAFDDLESLAASDDIDAVYIASPNALHASQARLMLEGGKHVLVEKAFASNEREAAGVLELGRERGLVVLEAMRNIHTPSFEAIRSEVAGLGEPRLANFSFSKVTSRIARLRAGERLNIFDPRMSAGALCDMGIYCVAPAVALFGRPDTVAASGVTVEVPGAAADDPCGRIDLAGVVTLGYEGMSASLAYGKVCDDYLPCQVACEGGTIQWDQMGAPERIRVYDHVDKGLVFKLEQPEARPVEAETLDNDMVFELRRFVAAAAGDAAALAEVEAFGRVTLDTAYVLDEARRRMGVVFPADLEG